MKRWFSAQPIHRKLVYISLLKTTVVMVVALAALVVLDTVRYHREARTDAMTLATVVAENVRGAVSFDDVEHATETLRTLRVRTQFQVGCVYRIDGSLLASYRREPSFGCPVRSPEPGDLAWTALAGIAPVVHDDRLVGTVFVERGWSTLRERLAAASLGSVMVLTLAGIMMVGLSYRLYRPIWEPITQLAAAARQTGEPETYRMPDIRAGNDEVGALVASFGAMMDRVRDANRDLSRSNDALRQEIAERRQVEAEREALLEREQEANRIKDEFLATVSHELRTPLSAILGWSRILATNSDPEIVAKATDSLYRNAQTQARVIDDLIDISRIVTGKLQVVTEPMDVRAAVDGAVDAIRPTAERAGVELVVHLPDHACVIRGDRARVQQIVWNLLSNAVKFAPRGRVHVSLASDRRDATLTVSDNGVGIAPEFIGHVFDRFRQADSSITRGHGGLGIGLAIVKELVEQHGGSISAASPGRGQGATFTVTIPCHDGAAAKEAADEATPSLAGLSVLVVDDNPDALDVIDAALSRAGADVRTASSGARALELWREAPPDVLLCDLAMPLMSGFDVLARGRELDTEAGRLTPAVAVSAHATDEQIARSAQAGFQKHVTKPFDTNQLVRVVHAVHALR